MGAKGGKGKSGKGKGGSCGPGLVAMSLFTPSFNVLKQAVAQATPSGNFMRLCLDCDTLSQIVAQSINAFNTSCGVKKKKKGGKGGTGGGTGGNGGGKVGGVGGGKGGAGGGKGGAGKTKSGRGGRKY